MIIIVQSFKGKPIRYNRASFSYSCSLDNEMDGESLEALLENDAGPECLKDLIPKLGVRLKFYKRIVILTQNWGSF